MDHSNSAVLRRHKLGLSLAAIMAFISPAAGVDVGTHVLGAKRQTLGVANDTVTAGYYAATTLSAVDADLAAGNIKQGVTVFGFAGNFTGDADAIAEDIVVGKTAYVNGIKLTGTLTVQSLSAVSDTVVAGNYTATTLSAVDPDLAAANIKPGVTIFGFAGTYTSDSDALTWDIMSGKTAYVNGIKLTGTIPTNTLSAANDTVLAGYYATTALSAVDADLAAANIKSGVTVFGVTGAYYSMPDTGMLNSHASTFDDDGDRLPANSQPSYTDHGDGTVTDNRTGLMWAKDGSAAGCNNGASATWENAGLYCQNLTFATYTDWRLPDIRELLSIVLFRHPAPFVNITYFPNTQLNMYWTSTPYESDPVAAWYVNFGSATISPYALTNSLFLRCVRGGV